MASANNNQKMEGFFNLSKLYSVEFSLEQTPFLFQFKLQHHLSGELFFLVQEDSEILSYLYRDDVIEMKFYHTDFILPRKKTTKISYITKYNEKGLQGHFSVGLKMLD
jgi:hypothetical protein